MKFDRWWDVGHENPLKVKGPQDFRALKVGMSSDQNILYSKVLIF